VRVFALDLAKVTNLSISKKTNKKTSTGERLYKWWGLRELDTKTLHTHKKGVERGAEEVKLVRKRRGGINIELDWTQITLPLYEKGL